MSEEFKEKHCPKCGEGYKVKSNERLPEDCPLDFWVKDDGTFVWNCMECGYEWEEKARGLVEDE